MERREDIGGRLGAHIWLDIVGSDTRGVRPDCIDERCEVEENCRPQLVKKPLFDRCSKAGDGRQRSEAIMGSILPKYTGMGDNC